MTTVADAGNAEQDEELELGAGAGTQDVTELDAWQKCGALSAIGMSVKEVGRCIFFCCLLSIAPSGCNLVFRVLCLCFAGRYSTVGVVRSRLLSEILAYNL